MQDSENIFYGWNATIILWVVFVLAMIFVAGVFFDSWRRKRKIDRKLRRAVAQSAARANGDASHFSRLRSLFQSLDEEAKSRERRSARTRDREKLL